DRERELADDQRLAQPARRHAGAPVCRILERGDDVDVVAAPKDSAYGSTGVSSRRLRQALIVGELALAIVLAASALVIARSALALHDLPRGVAVDGVMTAQVALNDRRYEKPEQLAGTTRAIADRLRAMPGIESAAVINYL